MSKQLESSSNPRVGERSYVLEKARAILRSSDTTPRIVPLKKRDLKIPDCTFTTLSNAYFSQIEIGRRRPPHPEILKKLAKVYGVTLIADDPDAPVGISNGFMRVVLLLELAFCPFHKHESGIQR